ncbi:hypothetical protein UFOVP116_242 [uncultured Caudovirales phage]|uniref:Uncharacterized protein n=1 Tax=uncultured Caudovirales phage TaxID=2100421 RepID=A0A6J5L7Q5_9CAUD|nr:hypothetical protein UFOVP116_242 [uncultured Caudovirales phage]
MSIKTEDNSKSISFTYTNNETGESVSMYKTFSGDCRWNDISEMYCRFLQSMGYVLDHSDVGAEH